MHNSPIPILIMTRKYPQTLSQRRKKELFTQRRKRSQEQRRKEVHNYFKRRAKTERSEQSEDQDYLRKVLPKKKVFFAAWHLHFCAFA